MIQLYLAYFICLDELIWPVFRVLSIIPLRLSRAAASRCLSQNRDKLRRSEIPSPPVFAKALRPGRLIFTNFTLTITFAVSFICRSANKNRSKGCILIRQICIIRGLYIKSCQCNQWLNYYCFIELRISIANGSPESFSSFKCFIESFLTSSFLFSSAAPQVA